MRTVQDRGPLGLYRIEYARGGRACVVVITRKSVGICLARRTGGGRRPRCLFTPRESAREVTGSHPRPLPNGAGGEHAAADGRGKAAGDDADFPGPPRNDVKRG